MQETSLQPPQPQLLSFNEFLTAIIGLFDKEGLRPCILRNYEGFPTSNVGNDVDFLIRPSELPRVIRALRSLEGVRIVGYAERTYVAHVFVEGVSTARGSRTLQLDFMWNLNWKGQEYLRPDEVLQAAIPRRAGDLDFLIPSPVHEAIISLLSSLLIGGWLKEKYFPKVQQEFAGDRLAVITALSPKFGLRVATRLVDSIIDANRPKILACVTPLRTSLALRSLLHKPFRGALAAARYYKREFALRYSPKTLEEVCILSPGRYAKTAIIENLIPILRHSVVVVEVRHSGPQLSHEKKSSERGAGADSNVEAQSGSLISMARIVRWVVEEWLRAFAKHRSLTLRVNESCDYDLFIAPHWRRHDCPIWFARLVGRIFPSPDLWILLDQDAGAMQSGNRALPIGESSGELASYPFFAKTKSKYVVLDASKSVASVTEDAYAAIIDTLAERTDRTLKSRF